MHHLATCCSALCRVHLCNALLGTQVATRGFPFSRAAARRTSPWILVEPAQYPDTLPQKMSMSLRSREKMQMQRHLAKSQQLEGRAALQKSVAWSQCCSANLLCVVSVQVLRPSVFLRCSHMETKLLKTAIAVAEQYHVWVN